MSLSPLISIITITYNASSTVERTILSVDSQLFDDYEHIIVDGKSTDDTLLVAKSIHNPNRIIVSEPDKGIYDAMNKGLKLSKGQYVILLNSGDKFHNNETLTKIANAIKSNSTCDIVYGQTDLVDDSGKFLAPRHLTAPANLQWHDFARGMLVCHQAFIVNRNIAPAYNLNYRFSADYDWCIRCLQKSQSNVFIDDVLIDYLSEGTTTANRRKSLIERFQIMTNYYGFWSTLMRHFSFIERFIKHKKALKKA